MTTPGSVVDLEKLKVADLKRELKSRGLSTIGNKSELLERLQEVLNPATADVTEEDVNEDDVLGEDEILSETDKSAELLISENVMLSAVESSKPSPTQLTEKENTLLAIGIGTKKPSMETDVSKAKPEKPPPVSVKSMTSQERLELRAKRFNVQARDVDRKMARARRFGMNMTTPTNAPDASNKDYEKLKQRANRFGSSVSTTLKKVEDNERLKKRKERFGAIVVAGGTKHPEDIATKKAKRAERFGL